MAFVWLFVYRYTPFMVRWVDSRYQGLVPSSDVLNQLHGDAVVPSCRRLAFRLQYSARVQSRHMEWYFRPCHSLYVVLFCGDTSAFIVCNGVLRFCFVVCCMSYRCHRPAVAFHFFIPLGMKMSNSTSKYVVSSPVLFSFSWLSMTLTMQDCRPNRDF